MDSERRIHVRSPSGETIDAPMFTPQSSTAVSPKMSVSLPAFGQDIPIQSVESPATGSYMSSPRIRTSSNDYDTVLGGLKDVKLKPSKQDSQLFHFGQQQDLSPFTFRSLHNTTPEPTAGADQATASNLISGPGSRSGLGLERSRFVAQQPSAIHVSATTVKPQLTKLRASSAPVQPLAPEQPPKPARYDIKDEIPPHEPYFGKDFQRVLQAGKSVAQQIETVLGSCELATDRESQVFNMIQAAKELSKFDAPSVCTIGIVGDSGVGA
jgi:hypothetical protein